MKILIIGGTAFYGRLLVEDALSRGHEITLFNRGLQNPDLFPQVERLRGDRDGGLAPLRGRDWDAVIDTCGYVPRVVRQSAELLADHVGHYTFISSLSLYQQPMPRGMDEDGPVQILEDPHSEDVDRDYSPLKVVCEQVVEECFPGRALHIRPGLMVGPYDYVDRFAYWIHRIAEGGDVLAPGNPDRPVQIIDSRDMAAWNLSMVEAGKTGVYNMTGPDYVLTMSDILETCKEVTGSDARLTWVSDDFLIDREVRPFMEMPFWLPEDYNGLLEVNIDRALDNGLTFRPLEETTRDTWEWSRTRTPDQMRWTSAYNGQASQVGMQPEREASLLERWRMLQE